MTSDPTPETPAILEIKYEYVPEDVTKIVAERYKDTLFYNVQLAITVSIAFIFILADTGIAIVAMLFLNNGSFNISPSGLIIRWIIGIAILFISALVLKLVGNYQVKKFNNSPGKNGIFCEHTITLNDRGFVETTEVNGSFHAWEGVDSIKDTENYLTFCVRLGASYSIPKRAFANDQALREFAQNAHYLLTKANEGSADRDSNGESAELTEDTEI